MSANFPFSPSSTDPYSSSTDNQQQLRSLLHLLEQYQHHYNQLSERHRDSIKNTHTFQQFINKIKLRAEIQVEALYEGMKNMRRMLQDILQKSMGILPEVVKQLAQSKIKVQTLSEHIQDKQMVIQNLKQRKQQVQRHLHEIASLYEKTRSDNVELAERMSMKQQQFQNQSLQIRKTFLQVTQSNQMQKKILQQMYDTNEKLSNSLLQSKIQKKQFEQHMQKITNQLTKTKNKLNALQQQLQKKDTKIKQFQMQLQSVHKTYRKRSMNSMDSVQRQRYDQDTDIRQSFNFNQQVDGFKSDSNSKNKLNQQLSNYMVPTVKQLNGSFIRGSVIKRSIGQQSDYISQYQQAPPQIKPTKSMSNQKNININIQEQPPLPPAQNTNTNTNTNTNINESMVQQPLQNSMLKQKVTFDPYFSHYILISQSVKIKQDCQDMLNIDMKPYYKQVIEKRIPMHLWDQWIKNRLRIIMHEINQVCKFKVKSKK